MADRNDMLFRDLSEAEFVFECELHVRDPSCRRPYPATQLRKQRKYHRVLKKRQVDLTKQEESRTLNEIVQGIMSDNPEQQLSSTFAARIILSRETNPPIDDLVQAGIVSQLVNFLLREEMPELQFEACGALTNITSGDSEQTRTVVQALLDQALDAIESLLSSSDAKVAEKAVLFLGNIAGDGPTFQREFSKFRFFSSVLQPLLNLINTTSPISLLRNIAFTLSNLCSYKDPLPLVSQIEQYLHGLKYLITSNDKEVLVDTCWALLYISDAGADRIQLVVDAGLVPRLTELLKSDETAIVVPALRCISNIVSGEVMFNDWKLMETTLEEAIHILSARRRNNVRFQRETASSDSPSSELVQRRMRDLYENTNAVVNEGALQILVRLLQYPSVIIKKEAAWAIRNIMVGNPGQIQAVIDSGCLTHLISVLENDQYECQKEALFAVTTFLIFGTLEQCIVVCEAGAIKRICDLFAVEDEEVLPALLVCLEKILKVGEKINDRTLAVMMSERFGVVDKIKNRNFPNKKLKKYADKIIKKYFVDILLNHIALRVGPQGFVSETNRAEWERRYPWGFRF